MKLIKKIKKNYMSISIILLLLAIYVILFPVISVYLEKIDNRFTQCAFLRLTGKECPLCGGTRYFRNIQEVFYNISYLFQPFGIMFLGILFEIIFRIVGIIKIRKNENLNSMIKIDITIHIIMILAFFSYEILYVCQIY